MSTQALIREAQEHPELVEKGQSVFDGVMQRAATDRGFRDKLIADPRGALAEYTGKTVSESFNVAFVENKPGWQTIVLPDPVDAAAELSESELEAVAGGSEVVASVLSVIASILAIYNALN